jgi:hypothetical protein
MGKKPRGNYRGNSVTMIMRVQPQTRAGIERLTKEKPQYGRSMSQQAQTAMSRWIRHCERPHISVISDAVALLAEEVERRTGKSVAIDSEASAIFAVGVTEVLRLYTAKPENVSDAHQRLAELAAGIVTALIERDINWSWSDKALDFKADVQEKVFLKSTFGRKAKTS